jgi:hypothetical protein
VGLAPPTWEARCLSEGAWQHRWCVPKTQQVVQEAGCSLWPVKAGISSQEKTPNQIHTRSIWHADDDGSRAVRFCIGGLGGEGDLEGTEITSNSSSLLERLLSLLCSILVAWASAVGAGSAIAGAVSVSSSRAASWRCVLRSDMSSKALNMSRNIVEK